MILAAATAAASPDHHTTLVFNLVSIVALIIGGVGALGGIFAFFRGRVGEATIAAQAVLIDTQDRRIGELEGENTRCTLKAEAQDKVIDQQNRRIEVLESVVTGATAVAELAGKVDTNHRQVMDRLERIAS